MCQIRPDTAVFMFKNDKKGICPVLNSHTDNGGKRGQNKMGAIMSRITVSSIVMLIESLLEDTKFALNLHRGITG